MTDSEVRLARERIAANRVAVCFAASVRSRPPVRFEIDGKSFDIADARDVPGSEWCYSWPRPAGMSWSLGDIVLVKAFDSRNRVATGALRIIGEPVIGNTLRVVPAPFRKSLWMAGVKMSSSSMASSSNLH